MIEAFARTDMEKTKALADKFDRLEIRAAARLLILSSLVDARAATQQLKETERKDDNNSEDI